MRGENTDLLPPVERQNVIVVFGCQPSDGVSLDTQMIHDAAHAMEHRFDRKTFILEIPAVFEHLKGQDVNFEMITSSTLQKLELQYRNNIVSKSRGIVFVTDGIERPNCEPLVYNNADKNGNMAFSLFKDTFKFDTVELIENPTKQEVLDKLKEL